MNSLGPFTSCLFNFLFCELSKCGFYLYPWLTFSECSLCLKAYASMQALVFLSTGGFVPGSHQPDEVSIISHPFPAYLPPHSIWHCHSSVCSALAASTTSTFLEDILSLLMAPEMSLGAFGESWGWALEFSSWNGYGAVLLWSQTTCFVNSMVLTFKNMRWLRQGMVLNSMGTMRLRNHAVEPNMIHMESARVNLYQCCP